MMYQGKGRGFVQGIMIIIGWLIWNVSAADTATSWFPGLWDLPELDASLRPGRTMAAGGRDLAEADGWRDAQNLRVGRGWTAADMGFGGTRTFSLPTGIRRWREPWPAPVEWPGMRVETDYQAVAGAGRRRIPGGVAALAAAGLMVFAARKW